VKSKTVLVELLKAAVGIYRSGNAGIISDNEDRYRANGSKMDEKHTG
jgi:hypothetical protein